MGWRFALTLWSWQLRLIRHKVLSAFRISFENAEAKAMCFVENTLACGYNLVLKFLLCSYCQNSVEIFLQGAEEYANCQ